MKQLITAALVAVIGLFLVRITGRLTVAGRTAAVLHYDFVVDGTRILVRGTDAGNPLLVFVDDDALPSLPYARTIDAPLLDSYTAVHYVPAGGPVPAAVTDTLRRMYPASPVVLAGHGSGAAACLAADDVAGMVLINPPYDTRATDTGIFAFALDAAKAAYNKQAMCELITTDAKTGTSRCAGNTTVGRKWMDAFGGRYFNDRHITALRRGLFLNPDLSLADAVRYYRHRADGIPAPTVVPPDSIPAPVLVVTGTHTPAVWAAPSKALFAALKGTKRFTTVDSAGYAPHLEQPTAFAEAIGQILPD